MTYYELLQESPIEFVLVLIIDLVITLLAYCALPLLVALLRKKPIKKWKYSLLCYGVNFAIHIFLFQSTSVAYILWSSVFSWVGSRILNKKQLLITKHTQFFYEEEPDDEDLFMTH